MIPIAKLIVEKNKCPVLAEQELWGTSDVISDANLKIFYEIFFKKMIKIYAYGIFQSNRLMNNFPKN